MPRNPDGVKMAYTPDTIWRNRDQFMQGRDAVKEFLTKKWERENGYRLRKELFSFSDNKVCAESHILPHARDRAMGETHGPWVQLTAI